MAFITSSDIGKKFLLDNNKKNIVEVTSIKPNRVAEIKFKDGFVQTVPDNRLTEYEAEVTERTIQKVEIRFKNPDGSRTVKMLEGEQAELWYEFVRNLSLFADVHGANPPFHKLQWKEYVFST